MDITNKETNNKSWEEKLPQKIIDIVWESTDGGRRLTEHDFYHFEEEIGSMTELKDFISSLLQQERKAERERVIDEVIEHLMKENEKLFVKLSMLYERTKIKDAYNIKDVIKEIIESSKIEAKQDANKALAIWLTNKYKNL